LKIFEAHGKDHAKWKCIIYLGAMYVEATRESLYIIFDGKMLIGKEKSCIYQSKDNMIL